MAFNILKNNDNDETLLGNIRLKTIGVVFSILTSVGGLIYTVEDRYATEIQVNEIQHETTTMFKQYLILRYQDELMDLKYKKHQGNITAYEQAKIDRVKQRLEQLEDKN